MLKKTHSLKKAWQVVILHPDADTEEFFTLMFIK